MSVDTLNEMIVWIDSRIEDEIRLDQLSKHVGYSRYYCSTRFHEHFGMTFRAYVSLRRLLVAQDLLIGSAFSAATIARRLGYSSPEAFSRAFSKEFGVSPRAYRRNHTSDRASS